MSRPPVILYDPVRADQAFKAHRALLLAEIANAGLAANPFWTMIRQDAYERFANAFEGHKP